MHMAAFSYLMAMTRRDWRLQQGAECFALAPNKKADDVHKGVETETFNGDRRYMSKVHITAHCVHHCLCSVGEHTNTPQSDAKIRRLC